MDLFVAHNFLEDLAILLCIAAVAAVIFQALRQPIVVGYLVAGILVGPHMPMVYADPKRVEVMAEIGMTLLIFSIGLEFSLRRLIRVAPTAGIVTAAQVALMLWLGYGAGRLLGWPKIECLFAGAIVSISSTTIVAKAFGEYPVEDHLRELSFGILLAEDLVAILLLAVLTAVASGVGMDTRQLMHTTGRLAAFLATILALGMIVVPRLTRAVAMLERPETLLITSIGICFLFAITAERMGYSVALGAFLAGTLIAESGEAHLIEKLIGPVRDLFGAVFFVSVGMLIDPTLITQHLGAFVLLTIVVVVGKLIGVGVGVLLIGEDVRTAISAGLSLAQIGEFSFIIAGVGLTFHVAQPYLYTLAVAVSAATTFLTPFLIRSSQRTADLVEHLLPQSVQTFVAIYSGWVERARHARRAGRGYQLGRFILMTVLSAAAVAAIMVGTAEEMDVLDEMFMHLLKMSDVWADSLISALALALCVPFGALVVHGARSIARLIVVEAEGVERGHRHHLHESHKLMIVMLQISIIAAVTLPVIAVVQPFMPIVDGLSTIAVIFSVMGWMFLRNAKRLQVQVRNGVKHVALAIANPVPRSDAQAADSALEVQKLPGLGLLHMVTIGARSAAVGRTLAELNLQAMTGAGVIAISRDGAQTVLPGGEERLRVNDVVALAGAEAAIRSARHLLDPPTQHGAKR